MKSQRGYSVLILTLAVLALLALFFLFILPKVLNNAAKAPPGSSKNSSVVSGDLNLPQSLTSQATPSPQPVNSSSAYPYASALSSSDVPNPEATFIILGLNDGELDHYAQLANSAVAFDFRTKTPDPSELDKYEVRNIGYFYTAASSDYINYQDRGSMYVDLDTIKQVAQRKGLRGFYTHEVLAELAKRNSWHWDKALDQFDWNFMDQLMSIAKSRGVPVMWEEPTYAWQNLYNDPRANSYFAKWGKTLIPTFGTNFSRPEDESSRQYAKVIADKYGLSLGDSDQGWYWVYNTQEGPVTEQASFDLAKTFGWDYGARYFQFEGQVGSDLIWGSPFLKGVQDFSNYLLKLKTSQN